MLARDLRLVLVEFAHARFHHEDTEQRETAERVEFEPHEEDQSTVLI